MVIGVFVGHARDCTVNKHTYTHTLECVALTCSSSYPFLLFMFGWWYDMMIIGGIWDFWAAFDNNEEALSIVVVVSKWYLISIKNSIFMFILGSVCSIKMTDKSKEESECHSSLNGSSGEKNCKTKDKQSYQ